MAWSNKDLEKFNIDCTLAIPGHSFKKTCLLMFQWDVDFYLSGLRKLLYVDSVCSELNFS